jgi:hypothetical protein
MKRAVVAVLLMASGAAGVAAIQPRLAATVHEAKEDYDLIVFPPPAQLHVAVLGWDAAIVDMLWAKLLVEFGTHFSEHRDFVEVPRYVDAILELDPKFGSLYRYVDMMLAYRPMQGTESDVRMARAYLERGTRELPLDAQMWLRYGQFIAFVAPSFLKDPAETQTWRRDGALALEHAVELGADPDQALVATSMLSRAGATREAIAYLEKAYAFTEHPAMREVHESIGKRLEALSATTRRDEADKAARAIAARWKSELPVVARDQYVLMGPFPDAARCAGTSPAEDPSCARSWDDVTGEPGSPGGSP